MSFDPRSIACNAGDLDRLTAINVAIPGWSGLAHYCFFKGVLALRPQLRSVLMLGVYQGRDLAYLLDLAARYFSGRRIEFMGVDKFADTPCADWPQAAAEKTWQQAGFGEAPSFERAWGNLAAARAAASACRVSLVAGEDELVLASTPFRADLVYLDTAHDYETVQRQLAQVRRVCAPGALICGDDYSDAGTWGVKRAVTEAFTAHSVFADWIWHAPLEHLKP